MDTLQPISSSPTVSTTTEARGVLGSVKNMFSAVWSLVPSKPACLQSFSNRKIVVLASVLLIAITALYFAVIRKSKPTEPLQIQEFRQNKFVSKIRERGEAKKKEKDASTKGESISTSTQSQSSSTSTQSQSSSKALSYIEIGDAHGVLESVLKSKNSTYLKNRNEILFDQAFNKLGDFQKSKESILSQADQNNTQTFTDENIGIKDGDLAILEEKIFEVIKIVDEILEKPQLAAQQNQTAKAQTLC